MKWHNGPNGPGQCRARKGNCPYGGADSHFESEAEAKKVYESARESEYGLLPKVSNRKQEPIEAVAYLDNGIRMRLSNYVITGDGGKEESEDYFKSLIKNSSINNDTLVSALNKDDRVLGNWSFESENDDTIKLKNIDNFGNENFLEITRASLK